MSYASVCAHAFVHVGVYCVHRYCRFVCVGYFAGYEESGGELVERDGALYKKFYGMSSSTAMLKHTGERVCVCLVSVSASVSVCGCAWCACICSTVCLYVCCCVLLACVL